MGIEELTATARVPSPSLRRSSLLFQSLTRRRKMMFSVVPKSSAGVENHSFLTDVPAVKSFVAAKCKNSSELSTLSSDHILRVSGFWNTSPSNELPLDTTSPFSHISRLAAPTWR